jgi:hypothetical protein
MDHARFVQADDQLCMLLNFGAAQRIRSSNIGSTARTERAER